jgi:Protein of unknown function (DUF4242)
MCFNTEVCNDIVVAFRSWGALSLWRFPLPCGGDHAGGALVLEAHTSHDRYASGREEGSHSKRRKGSGSSSGRVCSTRANWKPWAFPDIAANCGLTSRQTGSVVRRKDMPKFVIERELPGVGKLSDDEIRGISAKSNEVLAGLPSVQWQESYVTDDRMYCVYVAPDAESILEHARRGGFPANRVSEVRRTIDPTTGE